MHIHSVIDKERRLVITIGEGRITFDEVKRYQDRFLVDADFDSAFNQLIDARGVTKFNLSPDEVRTGRQS